MALGIRSYDYVLMIAVPVTLCIVASYLAIDRPHNRVLNYLGMVAWVFAAMSVSRVFGPLILMPQIITGWTGASQTHPERAFRVFCLVSAAIALVLPSVLEWIGVLTPSYSFTGGHFEVLPQMVGFSSASLVYIFMMVAGVASTLAPALLVSQLRRDLSKLELRSLIQAWHFRRLPEDLMAAR